MSLCNSRHAIRPQSAMAMLFDVPPAFPSGFHYYPEVLLLYHLAGEA